ncbi:MAG: hypothetical protein RR060_07410, partial [Victivallaceae bacterium]
MPKLDTTEGIKSRILFFSFVFCIALLALIGRLYYVQIVRHDYYFAEAQKVYTDPREMVSKRGE